jgi:hypothetical protein
MQAAERQALAAKAAGKRGSIFRFSSVHKYNDPCSGNKKRLSQKRRFLCMYNLPS